MARWSMLMPLGLSILASRAQAADGLPRTDPVFRAIAAADARLFAASYDCDIATFASLIDENFEFYHDRTGLTVGKAALVRATRENSATRCAGRWWRAA